MGRFILGYVLGLVMAIVFSEPDWIGAHSAANLALAGGFLAFCSPDAFPLLTVLWAIYFLVIPTFESRIHRIAAVSLVLAVHLVSTYWVLYLEFKTVSVLEPLSGFMLGTMLTLLYLTFRSAKLSQTQISVHS